MGKRKVTADSQKILESLVEVEERVDYDDMTPWPTSPDGEGHSLHRLGTDCWAEDSTSWQSGSPSPGTFGPVHRSRVRSQGSILAEVGTLDSLTHEPLVIELGHRFTNPVVFAQTASYNGADPVVVRITNVQPEQFTLYLVEPSDKNGLHRVGEMVSYLVLEAGSHTLESGTRLEVGTVAIDAAVGEIVVPEWETVNLVTTFSTPPVVISQVQTDAGQPFLSTRQMNVTDSNFQVALEQEELINSQHGLETVGYVAMEPSAGAWSQVAYEVQTTDAIFTHTFTDLNFAQAYSDTPSFVASLTSYNDDDNAHLRFRNRRSGSVQLKVEEDTTRDSTWTHFNAERVSYFAFGGEGLLTGATAPLGQSSQSFPITIGEPGLVGGLDVEINIHHTRTSDLDMLLESPTGTIVELLSGVGGNSDDFSGTVLDHQAGQSITTGSGPFTGHFRPEGSLADFRGESLTGVWTLHVKDTVLNADDGGLIDWSLIVDLAPQRDGNLNFDSRVDAKDIDLAYATFGSNDSTYDLDGDGEVDSSDVDELVFNILGTRAGDSDLDLDVDAVDMEYVAMNYAPTHSNTYQGWLAGNFDGDGNVDISDLFRVVTNFSPLGFSRDDRIGRAASASDQNDTGKSLVTSIENLPMGARHRGVVGAHEAATGITRPVPVRATESLRRPAAPQTESAYRQTEFSAVDATLEQIGRRRNVQPLASFRMDH